MTTRFAASIAQDLKLAGRQLAKSPGFTLAAALTLALGIGANTATFSVVDAVLLKRLPYPRPDRLVGLSEVAKDGGRMRCSWANASDWRARARSFEALAVYAANPVTVLGGDRAEVVGLAAVSSDWFRALGVVPSLGRAPLPAEHALGAEPVAVVSHAYFATQLGGDRGAIGRRFLDVLGRRYQVVGVMPAGFAFPEKTEIWVPAELDEQTPYRTAHNYRALGRLRSGIPPAAAERELSAITASLEPYDPREAGEYMAVGASVRPLGEVIAGSARRPLWILFGASGLVLLIACANLASALLARGLGRRREMAIRRALGAGTGRLLGQLVTESVVLAFVGAGLGTLLGRALIAALVALAPAALPRLGEVGLDARVLGFTLAVSLATAILFGLLPGLKVAGRERSLRGSGGTPDAHRQRAWRALVAAEVALALVLAVSSGLLIRSFGKLLSVELGFSPESVATARLNLPPSRYPDGAKIAAYYDGLLDDLAGLPGIQRAGVVVGLPLGGDGADGQIKVEGGPRPTADVNYRLASRGYFEAMGIPLLRGRTFSLADRPTAGHVAVVDRRMAALAWPGQDPIGKRVHANGMDEFFNRDVWATVVGVVGDVKDDSLDASPQPTVYFSLAQRPKDRTFGSVVVRGEGDPGAIAATLRSAIERRDREVPATIATMGEVIAGSVRDRRFSMLLLGAFAFVALALAVVGIAGVVAYTVAQRRRELAIRLALGAAPGEIRGFVVRRSLSAVAVGLALGTAGAFGAGRLLGSLLFQVAPADPATFGGMAAILLASAFLASWLPATRTARIQPMETLKGE
ncbi:MAG TPA: ABC transporter permease [Thermoanaerobaculia bacterium]|jgi:predicted permease|nr:ABC transporter permease [Thermoanaerobaculia bacterium]